MTTLLRLTLLTAVAAIAAVLPATSFAQEPQPSVQAPGSAWPGARMPALLDLTMLQEGDTWWAGVYSVDHRDWARHCYGSQMGTWNTTPASGYTADFEIYASEKCDSGNYYFLLTTRRSGEHHTAYSNTWNIKAMRHLQPATARGLRGRAGLMSPRFLQQTLSVSSDRSEVSSTGVVTLTADVPDSLTTQSSWYVADDAGNELWLIDETDPDSIVGDFGLVGSFPSSLTDPEGMFAEEDGDLIVADSDTNADDLFRANPMDPDSTAGDYGRIGALNSGLTLVTGLARHGGDWWALHEGGVSFSVWRIDPSDIDSVAGEYGGTEFNDGLAGLEHGLVFLDGSPWTTRILFNQGKLIEFDLPNATFTDEGDLIASLDHPTGMDRTADGDVLVVDNFDRNLSRVDPSDPDSTSGDYGIIGVLPSGLTDPQAIARASIDATYAWTSNDGGVFDDNTAASGAWTAPSVDTDTDVTLTLTATLGMTTATASVTVRVLAPLERPLSRPLRFEVPIDGVTFFDTGTTDSALDDVGFYGCTGLAECWKDPTPATVTSFGNGTYDVTMTLADINYNEQVGDTAYLVIQYGTPSDVSSFSLELSSLEAEWDPTQGTTRNLTASNSTTDVHSTAITAIEVPFSVSPNHYVDQAGEWTVSFTADYTVSPGHRDSQFLGVSYQVECGGCALTSAPPTPTPVVLPQGRTGTVPFEPLQGDISAFRSKDMEEEAGSDIPVWSVAADILDAAGIPSIIVLTIIVGAVMIWLFALSLEKTGNLPLSCFVLLFGLSLLSMEAFGIVAAGAILVTGAICLAGILASEAQRV